MTADGSKDGWELRIRDPRQMGIESRMRDVRRAKGTVYRVLRCALGKLGGTGREKDWQTRHGRAHSVSTKSLDICMNSMMQSIQRECCLWLVSGSGFREGN